LGTKSSQPASLRTARLGFDKGLISPQLIEFFK
jgi:hypothetical protein